MSARSALIVDDSKSARFALRRHLESHAYKVDAVESAQEAYRVLRELRPDLIFMDHVMPGEDGFEALRHLKADPHTAAIPVVICSGNEGDGFVDEACSQGAIGVLAKPPSPDQLLQVLENVQRGREQVQMESAQLAAAARASADAQAAADAVRVGAQATAQAEAVQAEANKDRELQAAAGEQVQFAELRAAMAQLEARLGATPAAVVEVEMRLQQTEQRLLQRIERLEEELTAARARLEEGTEHSAQLAADRIAEALLKALGRN